MAAKNSLGSILRRLRLEKRKKTIEKDQWTQGRVAERIGVSRVTYIAWEKDEWLPDTEHLKRIVAIFRPNEKDELALYRAVAQLPPEKKKLPPRNTLFTGRNDYLDELHRKLQEGGNVTITQAVGISGLGGIGKTAIALEYAHQYHPEIYRTALWVNAANQATLQADYDAIARLLELPERDEKEAELRTEAVKRWLDEHSRWLLIMDNADDLQLARSFMPGKLLGHIILITRSLAIRESNIAVQLVVGEMKPQEAMIFLLRRAGLWDEEGKLDDEAKLNAIATDVRDRATELVTLLGRHPLALDQAGAYIEEAKVSITDYLERYQKQRRRLLSKRRLLESKSSKPLDNIQHPASVATTFALSFQKARELHSLAGDILHFCAFLSPDAIPEELFQHYDSFKLDALEFDAGITALLRYSLIKRNAQEKTLSMHRLVQDVLTDTMPPDIQEQWRERVVRALYAAFPIVEFKDWRQRDKDLRRRDRLLPHVLVFATWTDNELTPSVEVAELLRKAGIHLNDRGRYSEAETLLARALSICEQRFGVGHPFTVSSLFDLASLYLRPGKYEQAEFLYRRAIRIWEEYLGAEHPDIALKLFLSTMFLYDLQGKYEQENSVYQHALSILEQRLGTTHPHIYRLRWSYANVFHSTELDAETAALVMNDEPLD